jgi:Na+/H+ antiporter NhaB
MSELRSKIAVPLVLAGLLAVLFVAPVSGQGQTSTDKDWILENLARVEDRVQKQIDNVSLMIQLGTGVIAVLAGALALWGISNFNS